MQAAQNIEPERQRLMLAHQPRRTQGGGENTERPGELTGAQHASRVRLGGGPYADQLGVNESRSTSVVMTIACCTAVIGTATVRTARQTHNASPGPAWILPAPCAATTAPAF